MATLIFPDRTLYRHRPVILKRLEVVSWGAEARELAQATMRKTAQARTDPADIINSAIGSLGQIGVGDSTLELRGVQITEPYSSTNQANGQFDCQSILAHPVKT